MSSTRATRRSPRVASQADARSDAPDAGHIVGYARSDAPDAGHVVDTVASPRPSSSQPKPALSTRNALTVLKKGRHLPSMLSGSAQNHVKKLLDGIPAEERAGIVESIGLLLPPTVASFIYDSVVAYLRTLPPEARTMLARSAAPLVPGLQLERGANAGAYVRLLKKLQEMSPDDRQKTVSNCLALLRPQWWDNARADELVKLCGVLQQVPRDDAAALAGDARRLFDEPDAPTEKLFESLTHLARLAAPARAELIAQCEAVLSAAQDGRHQSGIRAYLATALVRLSSEERKPLLETAEELTRDLNLSLNIWMVGEMQLPELGSLHKAEERREMVEWVLGAPLPDDANSNDRWLILRTLAQIPRAERSDAMPLVRELARRELVDRRTCDDLVLHADPEQRQEHLARLNGTGSNPAAREGGAEDLENVMQGALKRKTDAAIARLQARFPQPMAVPLALKQLGAYLDAVKLLGAGSDTGAMRERGGAAEVDNARRTLSGEKQRGDFSEAILETPEMAHLCALVWHATSAARPGVDAQQAAKDQELMRHGLLMALARCIEDDGHRVCGVGQRQYMVDALKGFYAEAGDAQESVTPRSLVTVLTADFYKSHGSEPPTPEQVTEFVERARAVATERFGKGTPELADFSQQFDTYMRMTY